MMIWNGGVVVTTATRNHLRRQRGFLALSTSPSTPRELGGLSQAASLCCFQTRTRTRFPNTRIALPVPPQSRRCQSLLPSRSIGSNCQSHSYSNTRLFSSSTKLDGGPIAESDNGNNESNDATSTAATIVNNNNHNFFSDTILDFPGLGIQSPILLNRLHRLGFHRPTAVQAKAYGEIALGSGTNVTVGAETGSGKTLAYLLPLLDDILVRKQHQQSQSEPGYHYARAVILVPNKELVQQVIRMALPLAGGPKSLVYGGNTLIDPSIVDKILPKNNNDQDEDDDETSLVKLAIFPGGLKAPQDFPPFRKMRSSNGPAPVDLIVATPATLGPLGLSPKNIELFADIQTLVIDEADMLLDGGYLQSLEQVLMGFRRADKLDARMGIPKTQHVFVAATIPDYGLRSVNAFLKKRFPTSVRITVDGMHKARHSGLSAETPTKWILEESKRARMERLVKWLGLPIQQGGLKDEKVMIFLNTVQDVEGAADALNRIGYKTVPYHAKVSPVQRSENLDRFRRYNTNNNNNKKKTTGDDKDDDDDTVPIMVCTDLAARGLDVPNVTAVVQLQFAGNVVAHLHRMGRCGRAGNVQGRGFVFYSEQEAPLIDVVRAAEQEQQTTAADTTNSTTTAASSSVLSLKGPDIDLDAELIDEDDDSDNVDRPEQKINVDVDDDADDDGTTRAAGTVNKAFSRRRGFTRKRKQILKKEQQEEEGTPD